MTPDEIHDAIQNAGYDFEMIGEAMVPPVSGAHVGRVARRKGTSSRVRAALATAAGITVNEMFPEVEKHKAERAQRIIDLRQKLTSPESSRGVLRHHTPNQ